MVSLNTIKEWVTSHWLRLVLIIVVIEAIVASIWWFKPTINFPSLFTAKKPTVTYSFKPAPKDTGFALLSDNTKSGGFKALIGKKDAEGTPNARFEVDKAWMEFSLAGGTDVRSFESQKKNGRDTVIWKNVLTDADARYQIVETGLKEDIILKSDFLAQRALEDRDKVTISFDLTTFNVLPRYDTSGKFGLVFMDAMTNEYRFHIENPYLEDAAGKRFDAISYKLEPVEVAGGSLFEGVAGHQVENQGKNRHTGIEEKKTNVDIGERSIHVSSTSLANSNPSLANTTVDVKPSNSVTTVRIENEVPEGSNNLSTNDPSAILARSNQKSASFLRSNVVRSLNAVISGAVSKLSYHPFTTIVNAAVVPKRFCPPTFPRENVL